MKHLIYSFLAILFLLHSQVLFAQHPSSIAEYESTNKGLLIPRMTSAQRLAINSPAVGLMVFDLDLQRFCFYTDGKWELIGGNPSPFIYTDSIVRVDANVVPIQESGLVFGTDQIEFDSSKQNHTRMFYHQPTGAFRVGLDSIKAWDIDSLGINSFASGSNNMVSGDNSVGLGWNNRVVGNLSFAAGLYNEVFGDAFAVIGYGNSIQAPEGVVLGEGNFVNELGNLVVGNDNHLLDKNSLTFGNSNTVDCRQCFAIGGNNQPGGKYSLVLGNGNQTGGIYALAMGYLSSANGFRSIALGQRARSEGSESTAIGNYSEAHGLRSISMGYNSTASALGETALGVFNTIDSSAAPTTWKQRDRLLTVGNGQLSSRSDALVILKNGNTGIGTSTPDTTLHVVGKLMYQDGNEGHGKILVSDSAGLATWTTTATTKTLIDTDEDTYLTVENGVDNDAILIVDEGQNQFILDDGRINVYNTGRSTFLGLRAGRDDDLTNNDNTFIGYESGKLTTNGNRNSAVGFESLKVNLTGVENTAMGYQALDENDYGDENTGFGAFALSGNTTGEGNTGVGKSASAWNERGNNNVSIGIWSNFYNVSGSNNTSIGAETMDYGSDSVAANTALGYRAGFGNLGHRNVFLGHRAGELNSMSDVLYIDNTQTVNPLIFGNFAQNQLKINGDLEVTGSITGNLAVNSGSPIGTIQMWPTNVPPDGYLICNGDTFNSGVYTDLFNVLGTNLLPDFTGRFALGAGNNGTTGSVNHALGTTGGTEKHTLLTSEMPSHNHGAGSLKTTSLYLTDEDLGGANAKRDGSDTQLWETNDIEGSTGNRGEGAAHQNMPPFYTINFIIKAEFQ